MDKQGTPARGIGAPTIGYLRQSGVEWLQIHCAEVNCGGRVAASFAALELPDETSLPDVATRRSWLCSRCGSRRVIVMPDWPELRTEGPPHQSPDLADP